MTKSDIIAKAVALIQDGAFGEDEVDELLTQVVGMVAARVRIPSTKRIGALDVAAGETSTNVLTSIAGFTSSYISHARNTTTGKDLRIYPTLELMFEDYGTFDEAGDIEAVCFEDFMVWTQHVAPADQTVAFVYYATPTVPSSGHITWAPLGLHYDLFVHGIAAVAFGEIEDGLEDNKVNTGYNAGKFFGAISELRVHYNRSRQHFVSGYWSV